MIVNIGRVFGRGPWGIAGGEENAKKAKCGKAGGSRWQFASCSGWNLKKTFICRFFQRSICSVCAWNQE